jgi:hypothetical protein
MVGVFLKYRFALMPRYPAHLFRGHPVRHPGGVVMPVAVKHNTPAHRINPRSPVRLFQPLKQQPGAHRFILRRSVKDERKSSSSESGLTYRNNAVCRYCSGGIYSEFKHKNNDDYFNNLFDKRFLENGLQIIFESVTVFIMVGLWNIQI